MPFPDSVRIQALVRSRRHCCVCHQFAGRSSNVHHIVQEAHGGANTLENAICLCLRRHAEAGHYNPTHPLGTKYSAQELRAHRDAWWDGPGLRESAGDDAAVLDAYALGILATLDDPRLAILAALARVPEAATVDFTRDPVPDVNLVSLPAPQLVRATLTGTTRKSAESGSTGRGWYCKRLRVPCANRVFFTFTHRSPRRLRKHLSFGTRPSGGEMLSLSVQQ
jgi:HNH endonuclease